ncbi:hypothetical protein ACPOL_0394 [Acidisarcina polymorpha]|uniref:Uncharacterized protein n=1 Tax=Acidisarcina polymorpha TaxID=2211140 RepID=A0A2Z5FSI9_9BACT|nr:hypothetical protein ACPOL_0394 [Acidisarcina polymorpha]
MGSWPIPGKRQVSLRARLHPPKSGRVESASSDSAGTLPNAQEALRLR